MEMMTKERNEFSGFVEGRRTAMETIARVLTEWKE